MIRLVMALGALCFAAQAPAQDPHWPTPVIDSEPPAIPPAVLIVSKTNGFRHDSIAQAVPAIAKLAAARGWSAFATENAAVFNPGQLARFDLVVFASASGEMFTPEQAAAFQARLDETGLKLPERLAMGDDHPMVWWRCEGRARVFYSALGHEDETWADDAHLQMLGGAMAWAARAEGEGCD